jgi:RHS repeat-associated protein
MMGGYTYTQTAKQLDINFEGKHVVLNPGDVQPFDDACELVRFVKAAQADGQSIIDKVGLEDLQRRCVASGGSAPPLAPPSTPAATEDPSATDAGAPQEGADFETAQSLGAPDPPPAGSVDRGDLDTTTPDDGPFSQQYYDAQNPVPQYQIEEWLIQVGVAPDQVVVEFKKITWNLPPPGEPHPNFGIGNRFPLDTIADPVILATGQYALDVTDVEIPSRGFPLRLLRHYRSGPVYFGPWGYNWDHCYNVYLRLLKNGSVAVWSGELREDVYPIAAVGGFESPMGIFAQLAFEAATTAHPDRYVLTDRSGFRQIFSTPIGFPLVDRIPLTTIADRHGNFHALGYDTQGRLARVQDFAGRHLLFEYGNCDLLEIVRDHTGRAWRYEHDAEIEHLVAVIEPPVPAAPAGATTRYEYGNRFHPHPALQHTVTRVTDQAGRELVENKYGEDPSSDDFGRVVAQRTGDYENSYRASRLQFVPRTPDAINVPALRVEVDDPGILFTYTFNYRGDLLDERFRLVRDGSLRLVARCYRYDDAGNLAEQREPNGFGVLMTYDALATDPRARGNLLRVELVAPPSQPGPSRVVQTMTYEPQFHRLKKLQNEGGGVTTFVFDYETMVGTVGDVVRVDYPVAILPDGTAQARSEHFTYNVFGQITEHISGAGYRNVFDYYLIGPSEGYLNSITKDAAGAAQKQGFEYDSWGYRATLIDGRGNRWGTVNDQLGHVTLLTPPNAPSVDQVRLFHGPEGLLYREELPRGGFDDGIISDSFVANEYVYDGLGRLACATYGTNTGTPLVYSFVRDAGGRAIRVTDPLGRRTEFLHDERGLLLEMTEAAGTPVEGSWRHRYSINGLRVASIDPAGHRYDFEYDAWDRLRTYVLPGAPDSDRTRVYLKLNTFDRVTELTIIGQNGGGNAVTFMTTTSEFDARGRTWRRTLGDQRTTYYHDADERMVRAANQRDSTLNITYDGLGRIIATADVLGNVMSRKFDANGNIVEQTLTEVLPSGGAEVLLHTFSYDARNRPISMTDPLLRLSQVSYDARDFPVAEIDTLGRTVQRAFDLRGNMTSVSGESEPTVAVVHRTVYDAAGRETAYVDPEGHVTAYAYDARDRRTSITYPDGRIHQFQYALRIQPEQTITPGGTKLAFSYAQDAGLNRIDFTPAPGVAATPPLLITRDGLRRPVRLQQAAFDLTRSFDTANRLVRESLNGIDCSLLYDDLNGLARLTYSDGRVDRLDFDLTGRLSALTLESLGTSALTGALGSGSQLASYEYQGRSRVYSRTVVNGVNTKFEYDAGARLTAITHRDSASTDLIDLRYLYDAGDRRRVVWANPAPQRPAIFDYDGVSRLRTAAQGVALSAPATNLDQGSANAVINAAGNLSASLTESYKLARNDARLQHQSTDAGGTTEAYTLNAANQVTQLIKSGAGAGSWAFTYDGDGRCTQDDRFQYIYDAQGRLVQVLDISTGVTVLKQEHDPAGRVVRRTVAGQTDRFLHFGNRMLQTMDSSGTPVEQLAFGLGVDEIVLESAGFNRAPLQDGLSSTLAYSDSTGTITERYSYSPFGLPSIWAPDGVTPLSGSAVGGRPRFGGHGALLGGLYDARARIYDAATGRFLQPDPLGYLDSPNLYAYVHGDPVGFVDPSGEAGILVGILIVSAGGAIIAAGLDWYHQDLAIYESNGKLGFSWSELFYSAGLGAVLAPMVEFYPLLGLGLAASGVSAGLQEIGDGQVLTGSYDIFFSLAPYARRGALSFMSRPLGPSAQGTEGYAKMQQASEAFWNKRFYKGETENDFNLTQSGTKFDLRKMYKRQIEQIRKGGETPFGNGRYQEFGTGLYLSTLPGNVSIKGSAAHYADSKAQFGIPAEFQASISRWKLLVLKATNPQGVRINVPQTGIDVPNVPETQQAWFQVTEGPNGPGKTFNELARWIQWDGRPPQGSPQLSSALSVGAAGRLPKLFGSVMGSKK